MQTFVAYPTFSLRFNPCIIAREGTSITSKEEERGRILKRWTSPTGFQRVTPANLSPIDDELWRFMYHTLRMPVNWEAMHGIIDYSIENKDGPGLSWEQFLTKHKEAFDGFCKGKSEIALHQLLDRSPHTLRAFAWNLFLDKLEHYYGWATPES